MDQQTVKVAKHKVIWYNRERERERERERKREGYVETERVQMDQSESRCW